MSLDIFSPLSPYPWALILSGVQIVAVVLWDLALGPYFGDIFKALVCSLLFALNFAYLIYLIIIHTRITFQRNLSRRYKKKALSMVDIYNLYLAPPFIFTWLLLAMYFFDKPLFNEPTVYTDRQFYLAYTRFFCYAVFSGTAAPTSISPNSTLTELVVTLYILFYQVLTLFVLAAIFGAIMELNSTSGGKKKAEEDDEED
jgi:hypothetical protein